MLRWCIVAAVGGILAASLVIVGGYVALTLLTRGVAAVFLGGPSVPVASRQRAGALTLDLIGTTVIPSQADSVPQRIGGISGLTFDAVGNAWLAVGDTWAREHFFEIGITLERTNRSGPARYSVRAEVIRALALADPLRDAEGLAASPSGESLAVVYEVPPIAAIVARDGSSFVPLPMPAEVLAGCSSNRGFESVAWVTRNGVEEIWAGTEATLKQDRASTGPGGGGASRIVLFDAAKRVAKGQALYPLEPQPPSMFGLPSLNTLTDLCALPDGRLLALERSLSVPLGYSAEIFVVEGVAQAAAATATGAPIPVLVKRRIASLRADLGLTFLGNLEAMAVGPPIDDELGGRLLIIMADDNFGRDGQQGTQVIALRLR